MPILERVKNNLIQANLLSKNNKLLVGVSGGPDSMALIHILHRLRYELGIQLHIAHYNHKLRTSSDHDQKFVEQLGRKINIPVSVGVSKKLKKLNKGSLEEAARNERLAFFDKTARLLKTNVIILAHTQDDLAETVLMRILKGSGLYGLRAILPIRLINNRIFIRPLLNITKKDILSYLNKNRIKYCVDPTNAYLHFYRNKIRSKLLPSLEKEFNPSIKKVLCSLSESATLDYDYIESQALKAYSGIVKKDKNGLKMDSKKFKTLHPSLQQMLIRLSLEHLTGTLRRFNYDHTQMVVNIANSPLKSTSVILPNNVKIIINNNIIKIIKNNKS